MFQETLGIFLHADAWVALATLSVLEIVLGIDNIIFISMVAHQVEPSRRGLARRLGLLLGLLFRVILLSMIAWIISLAQPIVTVMGIGLSWRDIIFIAGGLFLLTKSTREIHDLVEEQDAAHRRKYSTLFAVIVQIGLFDIVFSIDSVVTAVGMAEHLQVMIAAVVLAMIVMMVASGVVAEFVERHPTVKMLALSFLLLIGMSLFADGLHFHIPRPYLYFAVAFSGGVEFLNQLVARRRAQKHHAQHHHPHGHEEHN
jgi:predicted tellurium resistance membrane protein TerC